MSKYFLRIEGVNLHNFVEDTQDLSTIRGGSLLLLDATNGIEEALNRALPQIKLKEITTGASIGVYEFETDDGTEKAVKQAVLEHLGHQGGLRHATLAVDVQLAGAESEFGKDLQALTARNRWQQMQTLSVTLDAQPADKVCRVDKVRPAVAQRTIHDEDRWISQSVLDRRSYGVDMKQRFYEKAIGRAVPHEFVWDLDELSDDPGKGNLHHKIAIIYLDGNRFGKIKDSAGGTREKWQEFDQKVKNYRREMLERLLDAMGGDDDWKTANGRYRIETLLWGGDEIIWVVPAWKGWQILNHFYITSQSWDFEDQPLRHAGGIVFCHHNAPIHRLTKLVRELADEAKPNPDGPNGNMFAYEVLESFDHAGSDFDAYRRSRCVQPLDPAVQPDPESLILAADQLLFLQGLAQTLREELPRRKLHDVVEELLTPFQQVDKEDNDAREERLKARKQDRETAINELKARLSKAGVTSSVIEQMEQRLHRETCWLHLQALWDYLS
jgi:hypothetical protein